MIERKGAFKEANLLCEEGLCYGAISRAYYSMFYLTQAVLTTKDLSRKKHSAVISAFAEHFIKQGLLSKDLHSKIRQAFDERNVADYEVEILKSEEDSIEILNYALEFSEQVTPFLKNWIEENN
ncbi:HEPN domain-containing protein [candidate division KSB1 bacterium]|nr:HEPN domain-containing protein [candidate division KSB1 bacterium]